MSTQDKESQTAVNSMEVSGFRAFLLVVATTFIFFLSGSIQYTGGMISREVQREFEAGQLATSWLPGLLLTICQLSGAVAIGLNGLVSFRTMSLCGCVFVSIGYVASSFATNMTIFYFTYAVWIGLSMGPQYVPTVLIPQLWYERKRAIAIAITMSGAPLGSFIFSPLCQYLIDTYGWRGSMQLTGALFLNGCAFALFLVPNRTSKSEKIPKIQNKDSNLLDPTTVSNMDVVESPDAVPPVDHKFHHTLLSKVKSHFDAKVLRTKFLYIMSIHYMLFSYGFPIFWMFLPLVAPAYGISDETVSYLLSIYGFSEFFGRVLFGVIGSSKWVNSVYLLAFSALATGPSYIFLTWNKSLALMYIFTVILSFNAGGYITCHSVAMIDLFGKKDVAKCWIFMYIPQVIAYLTTPVFHTKFAQATGKPQMALFLAGLFQTISGLLLLIPYAVKQRRKKSPSTSL